MALTEEQKSKIEEEEAYRTKLREEKKSKGCSGCLVACLLIVVALAMILIAINPAKQIEEAEQKASTTSLNESQQDLPAVIGKHAYNKTSGAYRGEILEVKTCSNVPELTCYVVNQPTFMRPMEAPVDNSFVKDEAPTPFEQP